MIRGLVELRSCEAVEGSAVLWGVDDYPFFAACSIADRLRCVLVEADALGLPCPMLRAIEEAACLLEPAEPAGGLTHRWHTGEGQGEG